MKVLIFLLFLSATSVADLLTVTSATISPSIILDEPDQELASFAIHNGSTSLYQLVGLQETPEGSADIDFLQSYLKIGGLQVMPSTTVCQIAVVCRWTEITANIAPGNTLTVGIFGEIDSPSPGVIVQQLDNARFEVNGDNVFEYSNLLDGEVVAFGVPDPSTLLLVMAGLLLIASRRTNASI